MAAPEFVQDWGGEVRAHWPAMFERHNMVGAPRSRFLEIGCFEGRTTLWLLENVLTHPSSSIEVIDTFEGSPEFDVMGVDRDFRDRFLANIKPYADRVTVHEGRSADVLKSLYGQFDFVFVDGSHYSDDVYSDAALAWPLLKSNGVMVFDDYLWGDGTERTPRPAIDEFLFNYQDELTVERLAYQCVVVKR